MEATQAEMLGVAPLLTKKSSSTPSSPFRRRKSKLTSLGRWDWAYSPKPPSENEQSFSIKFHVHKKKLGSQSSDGAISSTYRFFNRKSEGTLSISVRERAIQVSTSKKVLIFPTASISRLIPCGNQTIEIRAAPQPGSRRRLWSNKPKSWTKVFEFDTGAERDSFLNTIRGLNSVGGTVSSVFKRIQPFITVDKLIYAVVSIDEESGYEPPYPKQPINETEFFQWFMMISHDRDPNNLLQKIEESVMDGVEVLQKGVTSSTMDNVRRSQANSVSKRGPLYREPVFFPGESLLLIEDTVTFVHNLDSNEVRHVVGELILTNYRFCFSVYESELTGKASMSAMNGPQGFTRYLIHEENNSNSESSVVEQDKNLTLFGEDLRGSVQSLRFGRRPDCVFVCLNITLSSIAQTLLKNSSFSIETILGRSYNFQFDRADSFLKDFMNRVSDARKEEFFKSSLSVPIQEPDPIIYDVKQEFQRQIPSSTAPFYYFENTSFDLCSTYPNSLVLPSQFLANPSKIEAVARFRSRARIPAITWAHNKTDAVLARSSQPFIGLKQAVCVEDEELLSMLGFGKKMFVIDARGPAAVAGNQLVRGKGAEIPSRYKDVTLLFMGIGNIHTMRTSHVKLTAACSPGAFASEKFFNKVEQSGWLSHLQLLLDASCRCAEILSLEESSVLVHCSDGWDRTSQICSLAQIVLDPFYRTCAGLAVLVEKDWVSFGFKFKDRCTGVIEEERSPIWIQFLDCLFQFQRQFPKHFEYNEQFLLYLAEAPYSGRFATFAFNCEGERTAACKWNKARGWEFWTEILKRPEVRNTSFDPYTFGPLWPHTASRRIVLWESLHLQGDAGISPKTHV